MKHLFLSVCVATVLVAPALAQMPDVSQMSGVPLPTGDLPTGSVSVRVVRGDMSNNVANQPVELHGGVGTRRVSTDAEGRATFAGLAPGSSVHAMTNVDGQQIESQEFSVPATGGIRVMLVAPGGSAAAGPAAPPAAAAQPGAVGLGSQSRFLVEIAEEMVEFYALLELTNGLPTPVQLDRPLVFELPVEATAVTLLEGSTPQAKAEGKTVTVTGPLPAGRTIVQFAYQIRYDSATARVRQPLPLALPQTTLLVRKVQNVTFTSPQASGPRETPINGQTYFVANGPGLPAGSAIEVTFDGLPHHSAVPRYTALLLAALVVGLGVWLAGSGAASSAVGLDRQSLEARREQLLGELVKLDAHHARGPAAVKRYVPRRHELVTQLEDVYARLDELDALPAAPTAGGRAAVPVDAPLRTRRA